MDLNEEIAKVAYELFEKDGRRHGKDVEHWLEAERIVKARHDKKPEAAKPKLAEAPAPKPAEAPAPKPAKVERPSVPAAAAPKAVLKKTPEPNDKQAKKAPVKERGK